MTQLESLIERKAKLREQYNSVVSLSTTPIIGYDQMYSYQTQHIINELEYIDIEIQKMQKTTFEEVELIIKQNPHTALEIIGIPFIEKYLRQKKLEQLKKPT